MLLLKLHFQKKFYIEMSIPNYMLFEIMQFIFYLTNIQKVEKKICLESIFCFLFDDEDLTDYEMISKFVINESQFF